MCDFFTFYLLIASFSLHHHDSVNSWLRINTIENIYIDNRVLVIKAQVRRWHRRIRDDLTGSSPWLFKYQRDEGGEHK